jgi:Domain of unknown function (DUF5667)
MPDRTLDENRAANELDRLLGSGTMRPRISSAEDELATLVETARRTEAWLSPDRLSNAARARIRVRLMNRIAAPARRAVRPKSTSGPLVRRFAFALAGVMVILALLGSGVGVAYAAEPALPGDALYGVKTGLETVRLTLTLDPQARADYLVALANERVDEIQALVGAGRDGDLPTAFDGYAKVLTELEDNAGTEGETGRLRAIEAIQHHLLVLQALQSRIPASALVGLQNAQEKSQHGLDVLNQLEQGLSPSELAPGQLKKTPSPSEGGSDAGPGKGNGPPQGTPGQGGGRPQGTPPGQGRDGPAGQGGQPPGQSGGQGRGSSGDHPGKGGN